MNLHKFFNIIRNCPICSKQMEFFADEYKFEIAQNAYVKANQLYVWDEGAKYNISTTKYSVWLDFNQHLPSVKVNYDGWEPKFKEDSIFGIGKFHTYDWVPITIIARCPSLHYEFATPRVAIPIEKGFSKLNPLYIQYERIVIDNYKIENKCSHFSCLSENEPANCNLYTFSDKYKHCNKDFKLPKLSFFSSKKEDVIAKAKKFLMLL